MERAAATATLDEREERRLPAWLAPFSSLRYRDFALLWGAQLSSGLGMWMEMIGRSWLIYDMTGSAAQLGAVNVARAVPQLLFGLVAGVAADRMDRQKLVLASMTANMILTLMMAVMIFIKAIEVWHLYAFSITMGIVMAFQMPVRQAMIPSVVPHKELMNAFALNNGAMNVTRVIGPALAGLLIVTVGIAAAFFAKAAIFVISLIMMGMVRMPKMTMSRPKVSALKSFGEGLRYSFMENPSVRIILILTLVPMLFAMPYMTLMPVFAIKVLNLEADGFGILMSASGVGALAGSIVLASLGDFRHKGLLLVGGAFAFGATLMMTAGTTTLWPSMAMLLLVGLSMTVFTTTANTLLMVLTPEELRGRVMSVYMLDMALNSFGAMFAGFMADYTGVGVALMIMGGICTVLAAGAFVIAPRVRRL